MAIFERYKTIAPGHMVLIGNSLMPYENNLTKGGASIPVDTPKQILPSMATLNVPLEARVLHAELTWTSLLISDSNDCSEFKDNPVTFQTPTVTTTVAPQFAETTKQIYTRSADVTALVQAGGAGQYSLSGVAGVNGYEDASLSGYTAGWYLSIVFEVPSEPIRLFEIHVGDALVSALAAIELGVSGFSTPTTGPVTGKLLIGIQHGDSQIDGIEISTGTDTHNLNYRLKRLPILNHNTTTKVSSTTAPFSEWHIDIADFDLSPSLLNNQNSLLTHSISAAPNAAFHYNIYGIQIDVQTPIIFATKTADKSIVVEGGILTYTVTVTNTGTIAANHVTIIDILPEGVSFVIGSVTINNVPDSSANIAAGVKIGTVMPNSDSYITFQVNVGSRCPLNSCSKIHYNFIPFHGEPPLKNNTVSTPINTFVVSARYQGITDLIESVALEQTAFFHIMNAEGEKIQAVVISPDTFLQQLLDTNDSVTEAINSITDLEMLLNSKLTKVLSLDD